jgi:hypothetical protein
MRRFSFVVVLMACVFASATAAAVRERRRPMEKLDLALLQAVEHPGTEPVRALIKVSPTGTEGWRCIWSGTASSRPR